MYTKLTVIYHKMCHTAQGSEMRVGMARVIQTSQTSVEEALARQVDDAKIMFVFEDWPSLYDPDIPA